jgi:hypothetical protein
MTDHIESNEFPFLDWELPTSGAKNEGSANKEEAGAGQQTVDRP